MGVLGEVRGVEATEYLFLDERDWIAPGSEGFSEVGDINVEVFREVTDEKPSVAAVIEEILLGVGVFNIEVRN